MDLVFILYKKLNKIFNLSTLKLGDKLCLEYKLIPYINYG